MKLCALWLETDAECEPERTLEVEAARWIGVPIDERTQQGELARA